jgi:hypothetical protein
MTSVRPIDRRPVAFGWGKRVDPEAAVGDLDRLRRRVPEGNLVP